jgi:hypothetical protein
MRNIIRTALIVGTLATPMIAAADAKKEAPAAGDTKPADAPKADAPKADAPKTDAKADKKAEKKTDAKKTDAKKADAPKDVKAPETK